MKAAKLILNGNVHRQTMMRIGLDLMNMMIAISVRRNSDRVMEVKRKEEMSKYSVVMVLVVVEHCTHVHPTDENLQNYNYCSYYWYYCHSLPIEQFDFEFGQVMMSMLMTFFVCLIYVQLLRHWIYSRFSSILFDDFETFNTSKFQ